MTFRLPRTLGHTPSSGQGVQMGEEDPKEDVQLCAAECAARTGLTVRALRVYEREGLLHAPRSPSGWRCYGRDELIRINTICVLKEAGLTLAQMRAILQQQGLQLEAFLVAQIEGWKAKQEQAQRGRILADAALQRARAGNGLSIDQLCALVRSIDASSTDPAIRPLVLRLLDIPLEPRAEVIRTQNEELNPRWLQDYQEASDTSVAVEERVDGFELHVSERGLEQRRHGLGVIIEKSLERSQTFAQVATVIPVDYAD